MTSRAFMADRELMKHKSLQADKSGNLKTDIKAPPGSLAKRNLIVVAQRAYTTWPLRLVKYKSMELAGTDLRVISLIYQVDI